MAPALSGTTQNDILKEYVARGTFIYPPRPSLRLITDELRLLRGPSRWNPISLGYHLPRPLLAAQELAFTFGSAVAYVELALQARPGGGRLCPPPLVLLRLHNDFFEEIASGSTPARHHRPDHQGALPGP